MSSQAAPKIPSGEQEERRRWSRRGFLGATVAGGTSLLSGGCVATSPAEAVDLVWGRRGLSRGRFIKPRAIAIDAADHLYIVDTTGRIQVFDSDGQLLRLWSTPQTENGRPTGLAVKHNPNSGDHTQARLLVADTHYYRMLAYTLDGELVEREQIGGVAGHGDGEFAFVTDAVIDDSGCYYIGEYNASDRIQKFDPDGNFITSWGGNGNAPGNAGALFSIIEGLRNLL